MKKRVNNRDTEPTNRDPEPAARQVVTVQRIRCRNCGGVDIVTITAARDLPGGGRKLYRRCRTCGAGIIQIER